ncbi:MAG: YcaO-like family protein [Parcubacteria group bacterium]|nr:YcaO-like family protein [Parcubacteria group bacterium]
MKEFDVEVTTNVVEYLKQRHFRPYKRSILKLCLKMLEKYTGENITIPVSRELQLLGGTSVYLWNSIETLYALQSLGIVSHFSKNMHYPDEPRLHGYSAAYSTSANRSLSRASGVDFFDKKKAFFRMLGESVERHLWSCTDFFSRNQIMKPYKEIKNKSLNIFLLAGFTKEQKKQYRELQLTENTPLAWIPATSLVSEKKIWCPTQLLSVRYFRENVRTPKRPAKPEPMLRWCVTTGLATGKTLEEAIVAGILEVIERDAFMITFLNKLSPPLIDLEYVASQDKDIDTILKKFKRYNLEVYMIALPTDFPVHVVLSLVIDPSGRGPATSVGASADFDLKRCILDALSESLSVRYNIKNKYKDPIDLQHIGREERILYWAKEENVPGLEFLTKGKKNKVELNKQHVSQNSEIRHDKKQLDTLRVEFKKQNQEVCFVELSSKETRKLGFRTVFVVAPEMQPMHLDESIPYFGGKRLKEVPEKLGYKPAKELNKEPHPFP